MCVRVCVSERGGGGREREYARVRQRLRVCVWERCFPTFASLHSVLIASSFFTPFYSRFFPHFFSFIFSFCSSLFLSPHFIFSFFLSSQVLNRLTYASALSHLRRCNAPLAKEVRTVLTFSVHYVIQKIFEYSAQYTISLDLFRLIHPLALSYSYTAHNNLNTLTPDL